MWRKKEENVGAPRENAWGEQEKSERKLRIPARNTRAGENIQEHTLKSKTSKIGKCNPPHSLTPLLIDASIHAHCVTRSPRVPCSRARGKCVSSLSHCAFNILSLKMIAADLRHQARPQAARSSTTTHTRINLSGVDKRTAPPLELELEPAWAPCRRSSTRLASAGSANGGRGLNARGARIRLGAQERSKAVRSMVGRRSVARQGVVGGKEGEGQGAELRPCQCLLSL